METTVPKLYQQTLQPIDYRLKTGPCPTCGQDARLGTGAPSPQSGPPAHGGTPATGPLRRGRCPARGPRVNPRDASTPSDSDRLPPERPGSQSDAAAARHYGAGGGRRKFRDCVGNPRACSPRGQPGADTTSPGTARLDAQGLSTRAGDYHPSSAASGQRPGARSNSWNNNSEGCRIQETRILPHGAAPRGRPGAGGTLLVSTLISRSPLSG